METKKNIGLAILSSIFIFAGIILCVVSYENPNGYIDRFLFTLSINDDISPTVVVFLLTLFSLIISLILYIISRGIAKNILIPFVLFFVSFGITNSVVWIVRGCEIKTNHLGTKQEKDYTIKTSEKEGYIYIGDVRGYREIYDNTQWRTFLVYIKIIDSKKYYYCSIVKDNYIDDVKYLVQRHDNGDYGEIRDNDGYYNIIKYDFDWDHIYVKTLTSKPSENNIAQNTTPIETNKSVNSKSNNDNEEPQKIVVEQQRQPVAVQVKVPCPRCNGGRFCTTCGGNGWLPDRNGNKTDCYSCNGTKYCPACGGEGGYMQTVYQ